MPIKVNEPVEGDVHYQQDLASAVCPCGECDGYSYSCGCSSEYGHVNVNYRRAAGVLILSCGICGHHLETVAVAKRTAH